MHQAYFATTNLGKVESVSKALKKFGIKVAHVDIELPEPRSYDLREIAWETEVWMAEFPSHMIHG